MTRSPERREWKVSRPFSFILIVSLDAMGILPCYTVRDLCEGFANTGSRFLRQSAMTNYCIVCNAVDLVMIVVAQPEFWMFFFFHYGNAWFWKCHVKLFPTLFNLADKLLKLCCFHLQLFVLALWKEINRKGTIWEKAMKFLFSLESSNAGLHGSSTGLKWPKVRNTKPSFYNQ